MEKSGLELIGFGITKILSYDKNRLINLELASNAINNYILKPNDIFSFNDVLGERTEEKGYKLAESIDNKKIVKTVGGGICQVSSTLYIASKMANLKIIEVHKHSKAVNYVNPEDEAAVSFQTLDFKFLNNKNYYIRILSNINLLDKSITVKIYKITNIL